MGWMGAPGVASGPTISMGTTVRLALALAIIGPAAAEDERPFGLPLEGEEAEVFLKTARVVERARIGEGVTGAERLTLTDGTRTARGAWKTIDKHRRGMYRMEDGSRVIDFRDTWKSEVAAYELDKMLGLGLVPPTVEREVYGRRGSLQLWVEGAMSEKDRRKRGIEPQRPRDAIRWLNRMHSTRLLHQLTHNTDSRNAENVLVDPEFRVYVIDSSRAFRIQEELLAADELQCFSRQVLQRLEELDRDSVEERLGRWLDDLQVNGLLERRARILSLAKKRIDEDGPVKVLFH